MDLREVDVNQIVINENYRGKIGDVSELMQSIKENGLLQPVGISKAKQGYELVFGNRRLTAVKKLGLKKIPCILVGKKQNKTLLNIIENMQRKDVSIYEVGRGINRLINDDGLTRNEVAIRLGVNKGYIDTALSVFSQTPAKYRNKIISMDCKKQDKKKGMISSGVASTINSTVGRFRLKRSQVDRFYSYAERTQLSNLQIRTICNLLEDGLTFEQAIKNHDKVKCFRAEVVMSKKEYDRLHAKYGTGFVKKILAAQEVDKIKPIAKAAILRRKKKTNR